MTQDPFSAQAAAAAQFLGGGGPTAAKFPKNGFKVEGTTVGLEMSQQSDMDSGEPLFWKGKSPTKESDCGGTVGLRPCQQLLWDLQGEPTGVTWKGQRYEEVALPDDDGVRRAYIKGELQKVVSKALKDAGVSAPEVGSYLEIVRTGVAPASNPKFEKFTYAARYTPKAQNSKAAAEFLDQAEDPFAKADAAPAPKEDPFA